MQQRPDQILLACYIIQHQFLLLLSNGTELQSFVNVYNMLNKKQEMEYLIPRVNQEEFQNKPP